MSGLHPTMIDVARTAEVSLKTVSRFVNGQTNIDPALAERVAKAIASLGYRRNLAAASIRPGRASQVLGLIIGDVANPYYGTLSGAIERYARAHGYLLITANCDEDGVLHDQLVDRMLEQRVDGLLVVPPTGGSRLWTEVSQPLPPIVFLDRPANYDDALAVLADNRGGARAATSVLLANAGERVAFIGDDLSIFTMKERFDGYVEALAERGLQADPRLVSTRAHTAEQAAAITERLLDETAVDAVFTANNRASVGALVAFARTGDRLPIIGFDDFEAAGLMDPALSVVTQDTAAMGTEAAEWLIARLRGEDAATTTRVVDTRLILRGSERSAMP